MRLALLLLLTGGIAQAAPPSSLDLTWKVPPRTVLPSPLRTHDQRVRFSMHLFRGRRDARSLDEQRDFDRRLMFSAQHAPNLSGVGLFGAAVIAAAHAPGPLRMVFDRNWHLGPALLDGGGLGVGFGGKL
jgi:hypothetical protein